VGREVKQGRYCIRAEGLVEDVSLISCSTMGGGREINNYGLNDKDVKE
jgi:hypothetical protein